MADFHLARPGQLRHRLAGADQLGAGQAGLVADSLEGVARLALGIAGVRVVRAYRAHQVQRTAFASGALQRLNQAAQGPLAGRHDVAGGQPALDVASVAVELRDVRMLELQLALGVDRIGQEQGGQGRDASLALETVDVGDHRVALAQLEVEFLVARLEDQVEQVVAERQLARAVGDAQLQIPAFQFAEARFQLRIGMVGDHFGEGEAIRDGFQYVPAETGIDVWNHGVHLTSGLTRTGAGWVFPGRLCTSRNSSMSTNCCSLSPAKPCGSSMRRGFS